MEGSNKRNREKRMAELGGGGQEDGKEGKQEHKHIGRDVQLF